ncbi:hypothetical protein INT43_001899 [Umbelopsis isabellina]|uniref:Uncharacterized protein n=1 Tax=Mortierella isabellina TaxID=91625 RepID=A0A8H7PSE2_MORIS|nr:hypothetical protein INT43_001899 [Umbelopsis isabellina]
MDWQCFLRLVSLCSDESQSATSLKPYDPSQLAETIAELDKCFELFSELLEKLRACQSVEECASRYPEAGYILTRASLNAILAANKQINRLILQCLMEYCKLWDAPDRSLDQQDASKLWCLTRMRRLMHRPRATDSALVHLVKKITKSAQVRMFSLGQTEIHELSNYCVPLLQNSETHPIVLQLAKLACNVAQRHHDRETYCTLSPMFVNTLLEQHLRVYESWDLPVKQDLWSNFTSFVDYELTNLIESVFLHNGQVWHKEIDLIQRLQNSSENSSGIFLVTTQNRSSVYRRAFPLMAAIMQNGVDWRILQILETIHSMVVAQSSPPPPQHTPFSPRDNPLPDLLHTYLPHSIGQLLIRESVPSYVASVQQRIDQCLFKKLNDYELIRMQVWLLLMVSGSLLSLFAWHAVNPVEDEEVCVNITIQVPILLLLKLFPPVYRRLLRAISSAGYAVLLMTNDRDKPRKQCNTG